MNELISNEIEEIETNIIRLKRETAENIIQIGLELSKAKAKLSHGEWGDWLRDKVDFSQRTASTYMNIAKAFCSNSQAISDLSVTKLGMLLDVPEDKRENFIEEHKVKDMSTRELKSVIKNASDDNSGESCIDYVRDGESVDIDVDCLKPLPDHDKYFYGRKGREWIEFLNSVEEYGICQPIIIARDNTIISGHERVRACKDLGIPKIKAYYAAQDREMRKDCKNDDELKLKLFITSNFTGRSTDMYIAEYWMDQLFGTSYGDGSGDISHYLTDEVIDKLNHNRNVMLRIRDVVYRRQNGEITDVQLDEEVARLREEYV